MNIPGEGSITVNERNWTAPSKLTYPGGATQRRDYDAYMREQGNSTIHNSQTLLQHEYDYDLIDNMLKRQIGAGANQGTHQYGYDNVDQLIDYDAPQSQNSLDYTYDAVGNRTSDSRTHGTWVYDDNDRLIERDGKTYEYDSNGSLTAIKQGSTTLRTFSYNLDNRLSEVKTGADVRIASYAYDPFGRRISKTTNNQTTYFFYSQEGLVAELDDQGKVTTQYGFNPKNHNAQPWGTSPVYITQNGKTGYYQNDHLGTPQQIISSAGQVLWQASYTPFGKATMTHGAELGDSETITNNLRFAGQYEDTETNLHYNYFRYYDPSLGRYITSDPIGLEGGINNYLYAMGNPLRYIDSEGLWVQALPGLCRILCKRKPKPKPKPPGPTTGGGGAGSAAAAGAGSVCNKPPDDDCKEVRKRCRKKCWKLLEENPHPYGGYTDKYTNNYHKCYNECKGDC